jgi:hypothetical protein
VREQRQPPVGGPPRVPKPYLGRAALEAVPCFLPSSSIVAMLQRSFSAEAAVQSLEAERGLDQRIRLDER